MKFLQLQTFASFCGIYFSLFYMCKWLNSDAIFGLRISDMTDNNQEIHNVHQTPLPMTALER